MCLVEDRGSGRGTGVSGDSSGVRPGGDDGCVVPVRPGKDDGPGCETVSEVNLEV